MMSGSGFKRALLAATASAALLTAAEANASIVLNFVGLQDQEQILNFYNGGKGSKGSGPGPNFGISFSSHSLALISTASGGSGNFSNAPSDTIAFFLTGGADQMTQTSGFKTGFSFFYSSNSKATTGSNGSVSVFSGPNGTGALLAMLTLPDTGNNGPPGGQFNMWDKIGVAFAGTAESVDFSGAANHIGFDNVTLGSVTPGGVPEPASVALLGTGLFTLGWFRRRRKT